MVGQGGGLAGFDFLQTSQMELVGVPCQPAGLAQPERADSVERELVLVPAELVCLGHREPSEVVERQPAADVAAQFGGRGVGDPHELVEVEVAAVPGKLPGDRERQPEQFVEIEMRGVVAHRIGPRVVAGGRMECQPAARRSGNLIIAVIAQHGVGIDDRPGEERHELGGAGGVEVADPAGLGTKRVHGRPRGEIQV